MVQLRAWILALPAMLLLAQPSLEKAVSLARERRYPEAAEALRDVAEPAPVLQKIAFHRLKAAIAAGLGKAADAADEMEAALLAAPADPSLLAGAAVAELAADRPDAALGHALLAGNSAAIQALIGDIQEKRGYFLAASRAYQNAVTLAPAQEEYRIRLALELVQHYTFEPAIAVLRDAAPLFPRSARIRMLLGITHYFVRHIPEALESLTDAVEIDPSLEPAWRYLAIVTLDSTSAPPPRVARALCRWNTTVCGAVELRAAREQNDPALERAAMEKLRRAPPEDAAAQCELGRGYAWESQWAKARTVMEACVRLQPSAQNHYRLGLVYTSLGLPELAREQMRLRQEITARTADENERRLQAVQVFRYVAK